MLRYSRLDTTETSIARAALLAAALVMVWIVTHTEPETQSTAVLAHVHGLGVNPSDSRLYVATHDGLFVLDEDGTADLVGESPKPWPHSRTP